ncbi:MAG: hypothetical protein ACKVQC_09125 [Elusimicrobiota bacterium]
MKRMKLLLFVMLFGSFSWAGKHDHHKSKPHEDHSPKHGGQFFMAPDKFHHLEGAMPFAGEFQLYFYDDYTKPISAEPFLENTTINVTKLNTKGLEEGAPFNLIPQLGDNREYLKADLPPGVFFPILYTVEIKFSKEKPADLFNFKFTEVTSINSADPHGSCMKKEKCELESNKKCFEDGEYCCDKCKAKKCQKENCEKCCSSDKDRCCKKNKEKSCCEMKK